MITKALLALVRSSFNPSALPSTLDERHWDELLRLSISTKVFPQLYLNAIEILPESIRTVFQNEFDKHSARLKASEQVLGIFDSAAKKGKLRYVLFKGLGLSQLVYQDRRVRQTGDIDILVERDDVAKCDYLLRNAGFFQPDWTLGQNKIKSKQLRRFLRLKDKTNIPFPAYRWAHDVQLAPYYHEELSICLEVHDGLHFVPQQETGRLAWLTQTININNLKIRTFNNEITFVELLLNTFENSETFYACRDHELNLRDYLDISMFLANYREVLDWHIVFKTLSTLHAEDIACAISNNFKEVYGQAIPEIEAAFPRAAQSAPNSNAFLARLFDKSLCVDVAKQRVRKACKRGEGRNVKPAYLALSECVDDTQWQVYLNSNGLPIYYAIYWNTDGLLLYWQLANVFMTDISHHRLQIGIIPSVEAEYLEYMTFVSTDSQDNLVAKGAKFKHLPNNTPSAEGATIFATRILADEIATTISFLVPFSELELSEDEMRNGFGVQPKILKSVTANVFKQIGEAYDEATICSVFAIE